MAVLVDLVKEHEDATSVRYRYAGDYGSTGVVSINKATGEVDEIDTRKDDHIFVCAAMRVHRWWRAGAFPEKGMWAS